MSDSESLSVEPPLFQSREFLQTAGRALMRWWNENHGANLPVTAESFRAWWKATYASLESDLFAPSDVYEQLRLYADEARIWWVRAGKPGPAPPTFERAESPVPDAKVAIGGGLAVVVGLVVLALVLRSR